MFSKKPVGKIPMMVARAYFSASSNGGVGIATKCRQFMLTQGFSFAVATDAVNSIRREMEPK